MFPRSCFSSREGGQIPQARQSRPSKYWLDRVEVMTGSRLGLQSDQPVTMPTRSSQPMSARLRTPSCIQRSGGGAMSEITNLQQARELKAAGLPLNLEVETRHWSRKTSELMFGVDKAQDKFLDQVMKYSGSDDQRKYDAMIRAFNKFSDAVTALSEWCDELSKTDRMRRTPGMVLSANRWLRCLASSMRSLSNWRMARRSRSSSELTTRRRWCGHEHRP